MTLHPGRNLRSMCEHDVFLMIYSLVGHLRSVEEYEKSGVYEDEIDSAKINITRNINIGVAMLNLKDTIIYETGEVIPGHTYYAWYEKWFEWFNNFTEERWIEFDKKYISGEDLTNYLPLWYNYTEARPLLESRFSEHL